MQEQWVKWQPINNLANKYYVEFISETMDCLTIVLCEEKCNERKVKIIFESSVICYRKTDETFALEKISELNKHYGMEFYGYWTFFKVYNSEYLQWFSEQSGTLSDGYLLKHFCIITSDLLFDIATTSEPKVILLNLENQ